MWIWSENVSAPEAILKAPTVNVARTLLNVISDQRLKLNHI